MHRLIRNKCRIHQSGLLIRHNELLANRFINRKVAMTIAPLSTTTTSTPITSIDTYLDTNLPALITTNEYILAAIHNDLGLPWWSTIVLSTFILRSAMTLPIAVYQQKAVGTMINLAPMVQSWAETLKVSVMKESSKKGGYQYYQKELNKQYRQKVKQIYAEYGCQRWKLLSLPYIQFPLFICMTLSIRDLAALPLPWLEQSHDQPIEGFTTGGFGAWLDLTAVDTTMIFPILVGAGNLLNIELNAWLSRDQKKTTSQKWITNGLRCLSIAFVPIAAHSPMALCIYWCTSSWYSVVQNVAFRIPAVRKCLGLPIIKPKKSIESNSPSSTTLS
ncbi:60Kd inner membrane protein-domain-containing protein [Cunninghamella echinulata]|nr:60Kd inner membrane protein-domain-containing protein [Cunninghamella echinulata]